MTNGNEEREEPAALGNDGWIPLSDFVAIIHRNLTDAQANLAKIKTPQGHMIIKDLRVTIPAEFGVTRDRQSKIRFASAARALDPDFRDAHLAQLSFNLTYLPISSD